MSLLTMSRPKKATHAAVSRFIDSILPSSDKDVPRLYHTPRNPRYDPETAIVERVVISVTPTPGVYSLIGSLHGEILKDFKASPSQVQSRPPRTLCFLHRPFNLDRRNVRKGILVLSSHTSFDEVLTVGWNPILAARLGIDLVEALCVQGYKGDSERKIGIIGRVSAPRERLLQQVHDEFGGTELAHAGLSDEIHVVAIMNAFNDDEVRRVLEMTQERGWMLADDAGRHMLYITGQPRANGLEAAKALGLSVACVGHRQAEDWGIRYIAAQLRTAFPSVHVKEVYEEEVFVVRPRKHEVRGDVLEVNDVVDQQLQPSLHAGN